MQVTGWGKYPAIEAKTIRLDDTDEAVAGVTGKWQGSVIARGMGRSYGDSALAPVIADTSRLDRFVSFDSNTGVLTCCAGVSLAQILATFVPRGWFLPVTPGSRFVTVGGAVASDVHGKNHHLDGSFSDHLASLEIATVTEGVVHCSPTCRAELFRATCGGMGLTGLILQVSLKLTKIHSALIRETTIKCHNLKECIELLETHGAHTYSVAWVDCISSGSRLGRSLLMLGEHASEGELIPGTRSSLTITCNMPDLLLNRYAMQWCNALYYHRVRGRQTDRLVHYQSFFYPLDAIDHWNRMYGKRGFVQYQFVLPKPAGLTGMTAVLGAVADSKLGSFLSVLKAFGKGNDNYLSFPAEGYTLALDFKLQPGVLALLDRLDVIVADHGGRIYLTKDARMSEKMFKHGYPRWEEWTRVRKKYGADSLFHSLQSRRLGM